jgi:hypothetical protein
MADDLSESLDSLRFAVARPGTFTTFYPETTEDMLLQVLLDGMAEAQLEGLLLDYDADESGIVSPELTSGQVAVVVLFAALRFVRAELLNRNTSVVYKAGKADYETVQATNILRDIMKALQTQKDRVVTLGAAAGAGAAFYMADQYLARIWDHGGQCEAVGW